VTFLCLKANPDGAWSCACALINTVFIVMPFTNATTKPELERVTRLGLQKLEQILRIPTDRGDGNLLRAQTAAAGLAVNAQLRADEIRMKQVGA